MDTTKSKIPGSLRAVAVLHLIGGVAAAVGMLVHMSRNNFHLDIGVLGIPIYFGLLRWSRGWRTCALVYIWIAMLVAPMIFVFGLTSDATLKGNIFGVPIGSVSSVWLSVMSVPLFLLYFWQYRVLTRADIRASFLQPATGMTAGTT